MRLDITNLTVKVIRSSENLLLLFFLFLVAAFALAVFGREVYLGQLMQLFPRIG